MSGVNMRWRLALGCAVILATVWACRAVGAEIGFRRDGTGIFPDDCRPPTKFDGITGENLVWKVALPNFSNSGFTKGWVLTPADTSLTAGDPLRISTKATDADIAVVMFIGKGQPPAATIKGEGLGSTLTIAGKTISFNAASERIVRK